MICSYLYSVLENNTDVTQRARMMQRRCTPYLLLRLFRSMSEVKVLRRRRCPILAIYLVVSQKFVQSRGWAGT